MKTRQKIWKTKLKGNVLLDEPYGKEDELKGIFKISVGRVFPLTIITDEYDEEFITGLKKFNPLFIEEIDLSLEDIYI